MNKFILLSCLAISVNAMASQLPLPNWIDHSQETIKVHTRSLEKGNQNSPPQRFRIPAEYEPASAVVLGWVSYTSMLKEIARTVTKHGNAEVWSVSGPGSVSGADNSKYSNYSCSLNSVWVRDYGPFTISEDGNELGIVDSVYRHWQYRRSDDRMPECLGNKKGVDIYKMDLILDGGNMMVDTQGNLFMTNRTYLWNKNKSKAEVDSLLREYYNVKKIHVVEYAGSPGKPADGTGHIDMFVKLLDDETVMIAKTTSKKFKKATEEALKYFKSIKTPYGNDYKIVRTKAWSSGGTWYTFTNSLIVNNIVMMPSYSSALKEVKSAAKTYEDAMPGVKVYPINSDSSIRAGGSIHCVTQLVPKTK
ncbi:MAG: agmatine deiminase family protein [Bacteriovoracaceae bacterium]|nr:agmatine deiminase family protein [Bacteriovoracaceae bacterium]